MNKCILIMMLLSLAIGMKSQTLRGTVTDTADNPLNAVSVTLVNDEGKVITFAKTGKQGDFTLKMPTNKKVDSIVFTRMGYAKQKFPLHDFKDSQKVILQENALDLREVKVTAERIRQHNDTLVFSVAGFKQQQDRSIADVIKKMPGLDVKSDGQITYQGKPINEFTVEGMDLMGGKYAQISENLSADKVKSVEIRENNQPKRVLRNIQFSEQAALNLVLKDDAKNVWQGLADIATGMTLQDGTEWLHDTRIMAMNFGKKHQSVSMWKTNNNGKNIQKEVGNLIFESNSLTPVRSWLSNISGANAEIDKERYTFNNSQLVATNWLFKTKGGGDLRFQADYFFDKTKSRQFSETIYNDITGGWALTEDADVRDYTSRWDAELQYKINNDQIYLNNRLKTTFDFNRSVGLSTLNESKTRGYVKPRSHFISDAIEVIKKTKSGKSYSLSSALAYDFLPGKVLLCDSTTEKLDISSFRWYIMANFRHKLGRCNVAWNMGFDLELNQMDVENMMTEIRNVRFNKQRLYAYPSISYENKRLMVNASPRLSWLRREYESVESHDLLFEPMLLFNYKPNTRVDCGAHYNLAYMPDGMKRISDVPVFNSYRTMTVGNLKMDMSHSHNASAYIRYHHLMRGLFANVNATYHSSRHMRMYSSSSYGNFYRQYATDQYDNSYGWTFSCDVSKSFSWAKTMIKTGCSWDKSHYRLLVDNEKIPYWMGELTTNIGFTMKPAKILSIEEKSYFIHSQQHNNATSKKSIFNNFQHEIKVFLLPGKWQIEIDNEFYHSNDHSVEFCHFADAAVSYRTKRYEVGVWLNNIMGTHKYERRYDTSAQHVYSVTRIRPREVMARVFFNL